jgi:hypothetical protein
VLPGQTRQGGPFKKIPLQLLAPSFKLVIKKLVVIAVQTVLPGHNEIEGETEHFGGDIVG